MSTLDRSPHTRLGLRRRATTGAASTRGWVAVSVVVLGIVLIAIIGLAVDTAYVNLTAQQLQAAADAGALAGAQKVVADSQGAQFAVTRQAAINVAFANTAAQTQVAVSANSPNDPAGDVVVGTWNSFTKVFTASTAAPDCVMVRTRRTSGAHGPLALLFGSAFGAPTADISRTAIAQQGASPDPLILILHPNRAGALHLNGTSASMDVLAGIIHVNSSNSCAVRLDGSPILVGQQIRIVGGMCGTTTSSVVTGAQVEPDPLAGLPYPSGLPLPNGPSGKITAAGTYAPGRYPRGIDMNGGVAVLLPGIYSFGSGGGSLGVDLKGSALIQGTNVMLFIEQGARVSISGSGAGMSLTPPASGTYHGVVLFHHRQNTANNICSIGGGGLFDLQGTLYVPGGHVDMSGTPGKLVGRIIANTAEVSGTCGFTITGIGLPPATGPKYVYLVQ